MHRKPAVLFCICHCRISEIVLGKLQLLRRLTMHLIFGIGDLAKFIEQVSQRAAVGGLREFGVSRSG